MRRRFFMGALASLVVPLPSHVAGAAVLHRPLVDAYKRQLRAGLMTHAEASHWLVYRPPPVPRKPTGGP